MPTVAEAQYCAVTAATDSLDMCMPPTALPQWNFSCNSVAPGATTSTVRTSDGNCWFEIQTPYSGATTWPECVWAHLEPALGTAPSWTVEFVGYVADVPAACIGSGSYCSHYSLGSYDGSRGAWIEMETNAPGLAPGGAVGVPDDSQPRGYRFFPLDIGTPHMFQIQVVRGTSARYLVDGQPLVEIPYTSLPTQTPLSPQYGPAALEGFHTSMGTTYLDYVTYQACAEPETPAPPGSQTLALSPITLPETWAPAQGPLSLTSTASILTTGPTDPRNKNFRYEVRYQYAILDSFNRQVYAAPGGTAAVDVSTAPRAGYQVAVGLPASWNGITPAGSVIPDATYPATLSAQVVRIHDKSAQEKVIGSATTGATLNVSSVNLSYEQWGLLAQMQAITAAYPPGAELPWPARAQYAKFQATYLAGGAAALQTKFNSSLTAARESMAPHGATLSSAQVAAWQSLYNGSAGLIDVRWSPFRGTPSLVTFGELRPITGPLPAGAASLLAELTPLAAAGQLTTFPLLGAVPGESCQVVRFGHAVGGVPVLGDAAAVVVHAGADAGYAASAALMVTPNLEAIAAQKDAAITAAAATERAAVDFVARFPEDPVVSATASLAILADGGPAALVYQVDVWSTARHWSYLVDALTGRLLGAANASPASSAEPSAPGPEPLDPKAYFRGWVPAPNPPAITQGLLPDLVPLGDAYIKSGPWETWGAHVTTTDGGYFASYDRVGMCGPLDYDPGPACSYSSLLSPTADTIVGWQVSAGWPVKDDPGTLATIAGQTHYLWENAFHRWAQAGAAYTPIERRYNSDSKGTALADTTEFLDSQGRRHPRITLYYLRNNWEELLGSTPLHEFGHVIAGVRGGASPAAAAAAQEGFPEYVAKTTSDYGSRVGSLESPFQSSSFLVGYYTPIGSYNSAAADPAHANASIWAGTYLQVQSQVADWRAEWLALTTTTTISDTAHDPGELFAQTHDVMWSAAASCFADSHAAIVRRAFRDHGYPTDGGGENPDSREAARVVAWPSYLSPFFSPGFLSTSFTTTVGSGDLQDWFLVWVEQGHIYEFSTTTASDGSPMFDTTLTLVDYSSPAGRVVAFNDDCAQAPCPPDPRASKFVWQADYSGWAYLKAAAKGGTVPPAKALVLIKRGNLPSAKGPGAVEGAGWLLHRDGSLSTTLDWYGDVYRFPAYTGDHRSYGDGTLGLCGHGFSLALQNPTRTLDVTLEFVPAQGASGLTEALGTEQASAGKVTWIDAGAGSKYFRSGPGFYLVKVAEPPGPVRPPTPGLLQPKPLTYGVYLTNWRGDPNPCFREDESDFASPFLIRRLGGATGDIHPAFRSFPGTLYTPYVLGNNDEDFYQIPLTRGETFTVAFEGWRPPPPWPLPAPQAPRAVLDVLAPPDMAAGVYAPAEEDWFKRTYLWTTGGREEPLTLVAPRTGTYIIRVRPLEYQMGGRYTVSFRLHPWTNVTAPAWPRSP
jgi:hypothetical protein